MTELNDAMPESALVDAILEAARWTGWRATHFRPAKTSAGWRTALQGDKGFPDIVLARRGKTLFIETKSKRGVPTPDQRRWADAIGEDYYLIRPAQLDWFLEIVLR